MIRDRHRLFLIVGHIQRRDTEILLQSPDLGAQFDAQLGIQVAQRFIEQEHRWGAHQRPGDRDPLLLATGQLTRLARQQILDADAGGRSAGLLRRVVLADARIAQREGDVACHGQMWVQGVVLEHHGHVTVAGRGARDVATVDSHGSTVSRLESSRDPQGGGLSAAGRADQHGQRPVRQHQIESVDDRCAPVGLGDAAQFDGRHFVAPAVRPPTRNRCAASANT